MRPTPAYNAPLYETDADIECPDCGRQIPMRSECCPQCEVSLH